MLCRVFRGRIVLVSSFGAESAVLLDLVAKIDPATPVLFLDTGNLFAETLHYRDTLAARLGLTDIRVLRPDPWSLIVEDVDDELWRVDADRCCHLRKVLPLARGLQHFDAWISGRKRFQGGDRGGLATIECHDGKIKINPLANWTPADIAAYFEAHDLPRHTMQANGYPSIGCVPCTDQAEAREGPRAGRWRHTMKTECGIHGRSLHPA
jgi:phosphoadenosine phosphosulfate reductase